jgi:hypothetical protein
MWGKIKSLFVFLPKFSCMSSIYPKVVPIDHGQEEGHIGRRMKFEWK